MLNITPQGKVKVQWKVSPYDHSKDKKNEIRALIAKKYHLPKSSITISPNIVIVNSDGKEMTLTDSVVDNIQDPIFQKKLFKEFLKINKIEDADYDFIDKIDNEINGRIDYQVYDKLKHYTIKWIKWDNFRSYGKDNYFDFTKLHGLVLLNGEPANQSGKTTFAVDLLHFLLFGNLRKCKTQDEIFNNFLKDELTVKVEGSIVIEGEEYIIKRTLTRPKTGKAHATQKVEYFHVINGELYGLDDYNENESCEDTKSTNKVIKESIGREDDFDLIMCVTGKNLDDLIDEKPTERGRIFSRWIGLLPLEEKDNIAKEQYNNSIKPNLLSNQYNKETLIQEINAYKVGIEESGKNKEALEKANEDLIKEIEILEKNRDVLVSRKNSIDSNVMKIDISTLNASIERKKQEGLVKKETLAKVVDEIKEIGNVNFSVEEYDKLNNDKNKLMVAIAEKRTEAKGYQSMIKQLKTSEYCPTCGRKLDNVDNSKQIEEQQGKLDAVIIDGKKFSEELAEIEKKIFELKDAREKYTRLNSLNTQKPVIELNLERLRGEFKDLLATLKLYNENATAIDKNNKIDIAIRNNDDIIKVKRATKDNNIRNISQLEADIKNFKSEIEKRDGIIEKMHAEEKLIFNWKVYLDMVGKNGISKMVMRKALPIINARLSQLLDDVCDFDISIEINTRNEVEFYIIKDGIKSRLASGGSGFEMTASALALRCALAEVSTISKANFVIIDEILGRTAKSNYENMRMLYDKVAKNYDFIFHITHVEEVKEWHDDIVTVVKDENNISSLKQLSLKK